MTATDSDGEGGVAIARVAIDAIGANDWDMNIGRYVGAEAAEELDVEETLIGYLEARDAVQQAEIALDQRLRKADFLG